MREYLLVAFVAAAATYMLAGLNRRFSARIGAIKQVRDRDVHSVPIPTLGGLAILGGIGVSFVLATNLPFLGSVPEIGSDVWVLFAGGVVMALVGAIDDVVELDPITKLAGQLVAAGIVVAGGIQMNWVPLPRGEILSLPPDLGAVITTILIVGTANAVNFVDGLDGLAAGIVGIAAGAFCLYSYLLALRDVNLNRATTATLVTAVVAGGCLGILPHNGFPARIFIGDTGALMLGFFLACGTISLTGWLDPGVIDRTGASGLSALPMLLPLILPFGVLALPFADMLLAVVRRTWRGQNPMAADKEHLHHRMLRIGHSHPRAVLVMYIWAGLAAFSLVVIGQWPYAWTVALTVAAAAGAVWLTVLIPDRKGGAPHPR